MSLSDPTPSELRQSIIAQGFALLPNLFAENELAEQRRLFTEIHRAHGAPSLAGFGMGIHPLLSVCPAFAAFYQHPELVAACEAVLGGPVRLAHSGARLASEASSANLGWHHHYGWADAGVLARAQPERMLLNVYVDGSDDAIGPLVVLPRRLNDPLTPPSTDIHATWPGERTVACAPGTGVIFDTALWHTAHRGVQAGHRRLWGGHLQRLDSLKPHREDNGDPAVQFSRLAVPVAA